MISKQSLSITITILFRISSCATQSYEQAVITKYSEISDSPIIVNNVNSEADPKWHKDCNRFKCFDSLHCEINDAKKLSYYVYPPLTFVDVDNRPLYSTKWMISDQYRQVLDSFLTSSRMTLDPRKACIFVPSIDISSLNLSNQSLAIAILENLPYWRFVDGKPGTNHIVISLDPTSDIKKILPVIGRSMLVTNQHDTWTLRPEFDYSLPVFSKNQQLDHNVGEGRDSKRRWQLISTQYSSLSSRQKVSLQDLEMNMTEDLLVLGRECSMPIDAIIRDEALSCKISDESQSDCRCTRDGRIHMRYPDLLMTARYCLIFYPGSIDQEPIVGDSIVYLLGESLKRGCVPIVADDYVLPYHDIVPWSEVLISLSNSETLTNIAKLISFIDQNSYNRMSLKAKEIWSSHFESVNQAVVNTMRHYDYFLYPELILKLRNQYDRSDL